MIMFLVTQNMVYLNDILLEDRARPSN